MGSFLVLETTHRESVRPNTVTRRVHGSGIEGQIVTGRRVRTRRPVEAVRPLSSERTVGGIAVACVWHFKYCREIKSIRLVP